MDLQIFSFNRVILITVGGDNMVVKIYADVLFAISSLMVFTAYGAVALIYNLHVRVLRIILGSCVISFFSTVIVLYFGNTVNPVSVFALAMLGTYLCLNVTALKRNIACSFSALAFGALIGGVKTAAAQLSLQGDTALGIILTTALLYIGFFAVIKRVRAVTVKKQQFCRLTVCKGESKAELIALVDTGNELKGHELESVIIAERQAVDCLFKEANTSLRLLPFKSIGRADGVLIGVMCDYVLIDGVRKNGVIVAAVDTALGDGMYNALINPGVNAD